mmetsp:Transcript_18073/g.46199  ORF Transcript_18073/g.46199 Transcript_18073/m.46199 type:complete len:98 (-) Transcript_18073:812-1105(-)
MRNCECRWALGAVGPCMLYTLDSTSLPRNSVYSPAWAHHDQAPLRQLNASQQVLTASVSLHHMLAPPVLRPRSASRLTLCVPLTSAMPRSLTAQLHH